jgi:7-carboxy-7-deazaguanine synthase
MQISENRIRINEVFTSIEGEGIYVGTKTLFVRLAGCHLKCRWCDTEYALALDSGREYSLNEAKEMIENSIQPHTYKANFTGGEPLLQDQAIIFLSNFLRNVKGLKTYLESSCFDSSRFSNVLPYIDICKIEFKSPDSGVTESKNYSNLLRNEFECLELATRENKTTYIKVVTTNLTSIKWFEELIEVIFTKIKASEISGFVIQPVYGTDEPVLEKLLNFYDITFPSYPEVRIIPQLHKEICAR